MTRVRRRPPAHRHRIVLVDDDPEYLAALAAVLEAEGHEVLSCPDPYAGLQLVKTSRPQLMLVDYYMPGKSGADFVADLRRHDQTVQILLVTGYPDDQPGRRLLQRLDIQGYRDKTDDPDRLLMGVDAALRQHRSTARLHAHRLRLDAVAHAGPELAKLRPVEELFDAALQHAALLLGAHSGGLAATDNCGLFAMRTGQAVSIRAGRGAFAGAAAASDLPPAAAAAVAQGLELEAPASLDGWVALPLRTRDGDRGCLLLQGESLDADAVAACEIYARQVVQSLENLTLYRQATHDVLCDLYNRGFGARRLSESLALAARSGASTSVVMLDVDHFKRFNDTHGHAAGDRVLVALSDVLRDGFRESDVFCRWGGEEFLAVLPETDAEGAATMAERMREAIAGLQLDFEGERLAVTASLGTATCIAGAERPDELVQRADRALYEAKRAGRNRVVAAAGMGEAA